MSRRAAFAAAVGIIAAGLLAWWWSNRYSDLGGGSGGDSGAADENRAAGLAATTKAPAKEPVLEFTAKDALETQAPADTVYGVVSSTDGTSVADLRVWAADARQETRFRIESYGRGLTGADGAFRIRQIPAGAAVLLTIEVDSTRTLAPQVRATAGGPPARMTISTRPILALTVLDPAGKPLPGAGVTKTGRLPGARDWQWDGYAWAASTTNASGVAHLVSGDARFVWTLRVEPPLDRDDVGILVKDGWDPAETSVRLPPAQTLAGIVRDDEGQPNSDAYVAWRMGEGPWEGANVQYDATFEIRRLGAGAVQLLVLPTAPIGVPKRDWRAQRIVDAGAKNVVLSVGKGAPLEIRVKGWESFAPGSAYLAREGPEEQTMYAQVSTDGIARFQGLAAEASYVLYVPGLGSAASFENQPCVLKQGVKASMSPLAVPMDEAKSARVRLGPLPGDRWSASLEAARGLLIESYDWSEKESDADHHVLILCPVPEGESKAVVTSESAMGKWRASAIVTPGKTTDATWEPVPKDAVPADR